MSIAVEEVAKAIDLSPEEPHRRSLKAFLGREVRASPAPIWNLPHPRNHNFTGREKLLADLHTALTSGRPAALTQAIHGLGGVGKTQLATEYAYRHAADYSPV